MWKIDPHEVPFACIRIASDHSTILHLRTIFWNFVCCCVAIFEIWFPHVFAAKPWLGWVIGVAPAPPILPASLPLHLFSWCQEIFLSGVRKYFSGTRQYFFWCTCPSVWCQTTLLALVNSSNLWWFSLVPLHLFWLTMGFSFNRVSITDTISDNYSLVMLDNVVLPPIWWWFQHIAELYFSVFLVWMMIITEIQIAIT